MWQPWVGHLFPGFTPERMGELSLSQYVAMHDFMKKQAGN